MRCFSIHAYVVSPILVAERGGTLESLKLSSIATSERSRSAARFAEGLECQPLTWAHGHGGVLGASSRELLKVLAQRFPHAYPCPSDDVVRLLHGLGKAACVSLLPPGTVCPAGRGPEDLVGDHAVSHCACDSPAVSRNFRRSNMACALRSIFRGCRLQVEIESRGLVPAT
jgi:hypothetical protein